jgi:hypothetical protein
MLYDALKTAGITMLVTAIVIGVFFAVISFFL